MSKRVNTLTPEQAKAEADALLDQVAKATTPSECLAALDAIGKADEAKAKADEAASLATARNRGDLLWRAYKGRKAEAGEQAGTPADVDFAKVRETLGIPAKLSTDDRKAGKVWAPWHGMAYATAEQAYALRQYAPETGGLAEQAWRRFLATADAEQVAYLGTQPRSIIGLVTFARRAAKGTDGIEMPTSGTTAARRDLLCESVIAAANTKIADRGAEAQTTRDRQVSLRDAVVRASTLPLIDGVPMLSGLMVSHWTDKQIDSAIDALRLIKGYERPKAETTPEQAEQAEQVAGLAEQAEAKAETPRVSALSLLTPEQIAALSPEQVAALA